MQAQLQEIEELEENSKRQSHEIERHLRDAQGQLQEKEEELLNSKILMRDMELEESQGRTRRD